METCVVGVNVSDVEQKTPLHTAAKIGNHDHAHFLLLAGASVHATTAKGKTPLHQATSPKIVRLLLDSGANPFRLNKNVVLVESKSSSGFIFF